jgi:hypothetical protein
VIVYDPTQHEIILTDWYLRQLLSEPEEFQQLFAKPLRSLTEILNWAKNTVKVIFELDALGVTRAAWYAPDLSGAWFGCWMRKDKRGEVGAVVFIRNAYRYGLEFFPVLISLTKQERLDPVLRRLGNEYVGKVPYLFDGEAAFVYVQTKESFYGQLYERRGKDRDQLTKLSLRAAVGAIREPAVQDVQTDRAAPSVANGRRASNRRRQRTNTHRRRQHGRSAPSVQQQLPEPEEPTGSIGTAEQFIRPTDFGPGTDGRRPANR